MHRPLFIAAGTTPVILFAVAWCLAEPAAQPQADRPDHRHAELHARCTEARLRLAETRLEKAQKLNASSPGQVARTDVRWLEARVKQLREQVAATRDKPHGYSFDAQRAAAGSAVQLADEDLAAAHAANERRPGAIGPLDIRMLEQRRDIARLRAEIWNDPAFLAEPMEVLQMQMDQLADQMQDVLAKVETSPALDRR
ncbi:MAG: hypothetical protein ACK6CT_11590 [Planctomycetia bacterium]|jgi:hypothetical protein